MATWTTIPDSSLEPGKPIRSIDALALRDNPVAIAEAAPGAPPVSLAAIVAALASVPVGSIGSYAFLGETSTTATAPGGTRAGSGLRYAGISKGQSWAVSSAISLGAGSTTTPAGTWICMGRSIGQSVETTYYGATLWLRIA